MGYDVLRSFDFRERGDVEKAKAAYKSAINSHHPDAAPFAAVGLGALLAEQGDVKAAKAAYKIAIESDQPDAAANAVALLDELQG